LRKIKNYWAVPAPAGTAQCDDSGSSTATLTALLSAPYGSNLADLPAIQESPEDAPDPLHMFSQVGSLKAGHIIANPLHPPGSKEIDLVESGFGPLGQGGVPPPESA
jgi:hypothetical protein